jgi:tripartite-type tricarboxylate transporter receptor subunit TctC
MISRRDLLKFSGLAAVSSAFPAHAAQSNWPDHPIRLIVPLAPGGNGDIMARLAQPTLTERLGKTVVVENKGGAGGSLGTDVAARAAADGYTLLWGSNGSLVNSPLMLKKPPYDPQKNFTAIGLMALVPMAIVVRKGLPVKNLKELVAYANSQRNGITIGSSGVGGANHIPLELFKAATKANILHVPYRGGGPALADLLGGQVDGLFTEVSTVLPMHADGTARIIGLAADHRSPLAPEVETFIEYGLKDFTAYTFNGMWAPAGTPDDVIAKVQAALAASLQVKSVLDNLAMRAAFPATPEQQTPAGARAFLDNEIERTKLAMKLGNIQPE